DHGRIVDMDSPERLVARHCPERTVELATSEPGALERFERMAGVDAVSSQDGRLTIRGRGGGVVSDVIQCRSEYRIRVTDFRTVLPTLEDVFLRVTGHSMRD